MTEPADTLSNKRILVTGAAGFIGSHTCTRLVASGVEVLGLDDLNSYYDVNLKSARLERLKGHSSFVFRRCDVADRETVLSVFAAFKPHYVVHLAAQAGVRYSLQNPFAFARSNIDGFLAILEACRANPVQHLVYASSSSVYGANTKVPFSEEDRVDSPLSMYAATKRANELMAHAYAHLFRVPASGLRFFTVYGPWGRPDMAYFSFTKAILEKRPIDVYNNGHMLRDFTYIDDVVEAIVRLIPLAPSEVTLQEEGSSASGARTVPHTFYNVGNRSPVELAHFISVIETLLGTKADRRMMPMQPADAPATYADIDRLARTIKFSPGTSIEEGMSRFVAWYREFYET